MSIAKCHKEPWLNHSRCLMWFKAPSWQGPFSSLTLSVKTGAESRVKKTRLWFTVKPKRVFALAFIYPPSPPSNKHFFLRKKQACIKIHSVVSFGERHGFYPNSGRPILWDFHARTSQRSYIWFQTSWFRIKYNIYTGWTNHIEKEMEVWSTTYQGSVFQGTQGVFCVCV